MKRSHFRSFAILVGLLVCAAASFRVVQLWDQKADGYWPPKHLAPPVSEVADRIQVFVAGEPIERMLLDEKLLFAGKGGPTPLSPKEVTASVNGYDKARIARIPELMAFSALAGAGFMLFLVGLFTPAISAFGREELVDIHLET